MPPYAPSYARFFCEARNDCALLTTAPQTLGTQAELEAFVWESYGFPRPNLLPAPDNDTASLTPDHAAIVIPTEEQRCFIVAATAEDGGRSSLGKHSSPEEQVVLSPARARRREQNRAAWVVPSRRMTRPGADFCRSQQAYRQRREQQVRDLEAKLACLQSSLDSLQADNATLRREIHHFRAEREATERRERYKAE